MSSSPDLVLERTGEIATLVLNRPQKRNAITFDMYRQIPGLVEEITRDGGVKVLLVRGADASAFSAGADISEFEALRGDSTMAGEYNTAAARAEKALADLPKPTIAMIQGPCIGGGCGLALACDLRFSDGTGRFAITPAKLGIVYSLVATKRLVDVVGPSRAKYILYSGLELSAERAASVGLVDEVFPTADLMSQTTSFAEVLASRAQYTIKATKQIVSLILEGLSTENDVTVELRANAFDTEYYKQAVCAFVEKSDRRARAH